MAKLSFSDKALDIWKTIEGTKGIGLSPTQRLNLVDILADELHLHPVITRLGDEYGEYNDHVFHHLRVKDHPDEWCGVYYHPADCEGMTGSKAHNWTQWAGRLLGYGRGDHQFAPKLRPPAPLLKQLEDRGLVGRKKVIRFLSLEAVVFYLEAQQRTWNDPARIAAVRRRFGRQDIEALPLTDIPPADDEDVDVDQILGGVEPEAVPSSLQDITNGMRAPKAATRLPHAADDLLAYRPGRPQAPDGHLSSALTPLADGADNPMGLNDARDPVMEVLDELGVPQNVRKDEAMSDEAIQDQIERLQAILNEREQKRWAEKFCEEAKQGKIIGGSVWPNRGEWATVRMTFPNGREVTYYHVDHVVAYLRGELSPSEDELHALKAALAARHAAAKTGT